MPSDQKPPADPSADLSRLRSENARLREALEPFAAWASKEYPNRKATDTTIIWSVRGGGGSAEIVVGDFVRARAALEPAVAAKEGAPDAE